MKGNQVWVKKCSAW